MTTPQAQPNPNQLPPPAPGAAAWTDRLATWGLYAAAAGASVAAAGTAEAAIISGTLTADVRLPKTGGAVAVFNFGGTTFQLILGHANNVQNNLAASVGGNNNGQFFFTHSGGDLQNFAGGAVISGFASQNSSFPHVLRFRTHSKSGGNFPINQPGYVGFKLANGDTGYIELELLNTDGAAEYDELKALSYAYSTDGPISVPQASGGTDPGTGTTSVPEPSTLALDVFAMGAAGLLAWRRRRAEAQSGPAMH